MTADKILDWIIAIVVLFFILAPLVGSLFAKKKVVHKNKPNPVRPKRKPKPTDMPNVVQNPQDMAMPKKKSSKKKKLKYGSLKQAVILSEILKRPYDD